MAETMKIVIFGAKYENENESEFPSVFIIKLYGSTRLRIKPWFHIKIKLF